MEFMKKVAYLAVKIDYNEDADRSKDDINISRMNVVNAVFILIYGALTGILIYGLLFYDQNGNYPFILPNEGLDNFLLNYVFYMANIALCHIWIYLARRFCIGLRDFREYFDVWRLPEGELNDGIWENKLGGDDEYGIYNAQKYKSVVFREIFDHSSRWFTPYPFFEKNLFEFIVKAVYSIAWAVLICVSMRSLCGMGLFHFEEISISFKGGLHIGAPYLLIGVFIFFMTMVMNYHSYFMCIAFTNFIRNVANSADKLAFNHYCPSTTLGFRKLVHASSRVAMAFFFDSMIYVIMLAICVGIGNAFQTIGPEQTVFVGLMTMCTLIPCIVSFLLVFLLSKTFLSRLLRNWRIIAIEEILSEKDYQSIDVNTQNRLSALYEDRLPLIKTELSVAVAAVAVDIISIVVAIVTIHGS